MLINVTARDGKTTHCVECEDAEKIGGLVIHPVCLGLDDNGHMRFGRTWSVSLMSGRALGSGAYKSRIAAKRAAKAMAVFLSDPQGETLDAAFADNARDAFDAARVHFA